MLGKKLAKDLGFPDPGEAIGKRVLIEARGLIPSGPIGFPFDQRTVEVEIVGIYEAPDILGFEAMGQALVLPLDLIRTLPGVRVEQALERMREGSGRPLEGHGRVVVRTYRTSDVPEAEKAIQKLGFKTRSLVTQLEEMKTFFVLMDLLLAAVGSVALVVARLGIANTLLMAVLERTREIGAYKAIGDSDGDVRFLFVAEASLVGLAGGLGGILLARAVAWGIGVGVNLYARSRGVEKAIEVFDFPLWLLLDDTPGTFLDGMAFFDERNGLAVGDPMDGRFFLMATADGGETWAPLPPASRPEAAGTEPAFAASGTSLAVSGRDDVWLTTGGSVSRVWRSADRGSRWESSPSALLDGTASAGGFRVAFLDGRRGITVGGDYRQEAASAGNASVTADGGRTWTSVVDGRPGGFREAVAFVPGARPPVAVTVGPSGSDLSPDLGRTWAPIAGPTGFHALSFASRGRAAWGVQILSPTRVRLEGENPFPWVVTVGYRGLKVVRGLDKTTVSFANGRSVTVTELSPCIVEI